MLSLKRQGIAHAVFRKIFSPDFVDYVFFLGVNVFDIRCLSANFLFTLFVLLR